MSKNDHTKTVISEPKFCDFCKQNGVTRHAKYDAKVTIATGWANMCQGHFDLYGIGLGLGVGQELIVE